MPNRLLRVVVSVGVIVGAATILYFAAMSQGAQYYKHVDEVMVSPGEWYGKSIQLHGFVNGNLDQSSDGLGFSFSVKNGNSIVRASYHGLMPDTVKDGSEVVLTGQLSPDGFHVQKDGIMAKCPSKYQADKK